MPGFNAPALLAGLIVFCPVAIAQTAGDWIIGTWWYADASGEIVEGDDKDGMVFSSDGSVKLVDGTGEPYLTCRYVTGTDVRVNCEIRGQLRLMTFRIDGARSRLANVEDEDEGYYRQVD